MLTNETAPGVLPAGTRIYAIGDIHGRADLLDALADEIEAHLKAFPCAEPISVFLGDYVDRGPNSRAVVDRLAKGDFPTPFVALRGNHEATLLDFLEDENVLGAWRQYGGIEALASYGVDVREAIRGRGFDKTRAQFLKILPAEHVDFIRATRFWWSCGGFYFCHAGVRPGVPLRQQDERDLLWIRNEFLEDARMYEKIVVHGHTPVDEPENLSNRINVDTGAFATGVLTCVVLQGNRRGFLSTRDVRRW